MTTENIAQAFSLGRFTSTYNYLAEDIQWEVVGERFVAGKKEVMENCEKTTQYFNSVDTDFKTLNCIEDNEQRTVVIIGTAEFSKNGQHLSFISACDVYQFNEDGLLHRITSYCIQK